MSENNETTTNSNSPDNQAPVTERPDFITPNQPETESSFTETIDKPEETNTESIKGKKKLPKIIAGVAVLAACICIAIFAVPKIINALSNKNNPEERLRTVLTGRADDSVAALEANKNKETFDPKNFSIDGSLNVSVDPSVLSSVSEEYKSLSQLSGQLSVTGFDTTQSVSLALQASQNQLATINVLLDQSASLGYIQIPELSSDYLSIPLSTVSEAEADVEEISTIDAEAYRQLLTDEIDTFLKDAESVELTKSEKITASDISSEYDKITVTYKGNNITTGMYDMVERASQEQYVKDIYSSIEDFMNAYSDEDLMSLEELLETLKDQKLDETDILTFNFYVDSKDQLQGLIIHMEEDTNSYLDFGYKITGDSDYGFECYASSDEEDYFTVTGTYTKENDLYSGSMTVNAYQDGELTDFDITFNDFCYTTGEDPKASGSFTISASELKGVTLSAAYNISSQQVSFNVGASMAGMDLVSISLEGSYDKAESAPVLDSSATVYDSETQVNDYLTNADLFGFVQNLTDATGIDFMSLLMNEIYGMDY